MVEIRPEEDFPIGTHELFGHPFWLSLETGLFQTGNPVKHRRNNVFWIAVNVNDLEERKGTQ